MSADGPAAGPLRLALLGLALCGGADAAAEEPAPDAAFLEYLGSWEGTDEDWLLFEDAAGETEESKDEERSDSEPEGDASPESQDER
jgi:hypothetical protein